MTMPETGMLDAVIMAGGPQAVFAKSLPNKTFIKIRNKALFIHALCAVARVARFKRVFIVGPKRDIEKELGATGPDVGSKPVIAVQETNNLVENLRTAFWESLGVRPEEGNHSIFMDRPIFAVGGDAPLILSEEVEQFLDGCDVSQYDYFIGMTPAAVMDHFRPTLLKTGISLAYTPFADDLLRINNMHLVKPLRVANRGEFNEIYKIRHLRNPVNMVKMGIALSKRHFGFRDWLGWSHMLLSMELRKLKCNMLADYFRRDVSIERVERVTSRLLGTRVKAVMTTYGGSALDVDKQRNIGVIEEHFDEWLALQRELNRKTA